MEEDKEKSNDLTDYNGGISVKKNSFFSQELLSLSNSMLHTVKRISKTS